MINFSFVNSSNVYMVASNVFATSIAISITYTSIMNITIAYSACSCVAIFFSFTSIAIAMSISIPTQKNLGGYSQVWLHYKYNCNNYIEHHYC
jgi:hypothetical protein